MCKDLIIQLRWPGKLHCGNRLNRTRLAGTSPNSIFDLPPSSDAQSIAVRLGGNGGEKQSTEFNYFLRCVPAWRNRRLAPW
jgi:hypothetical protein